MNSADISHSQQKDLCIGEVWRAVMQNSVDNANKGKHPDVSLLLKEWEKLKLKDSVLYRESNPPNKPFRQQMLLPEEFREGVLKSLHDQSSHLRLDKTYGLIRERFNWPCMKVQIEKYCKNCPR